MIVPSIDIMGGRAVQLRGGKDFVLDGGNPVERVDEFSIAGEVAIIDLDAALGRGSNEALIRDLLHRAPCRVGGGIRDLDGARRWLDAGAVQVMIGTAATPELCVALPRERVIAAVDAERGEIVVDGWRRKTGVTVLERVRELAPVVNGFLFTQVESEGAMAGFDRAAIEGVVRAAGEAHVTAAGGITTAAEVAELDRIGADAQVGMALYTGRLSLGDAIAAPLVKPIPGDLWPTVVCDEAGRTLGLVWSTRESLAHAVAERRGIYWSRSRQELWVK
jgi:phosphoribosylformimino-5-aminoimidazole carboxamide ribonucleotide (ProFAR) isomerase